MFWKKKEKYDMIQTYLDKAGLAENAEKPLERISSESAIVLDLCVKDSNTVIAQIAGNDEMCVFYCDPTTQWQKDKIREICIETGIHFTVEKDVDMDLPEEVRLPPKWSVEMPVKHWKKLTCLFMKEAFGAEEFSTSTYM